MTTTQDMAQVLADLRRDYLKGGLEEARTNPDPFRQFESWFDQVRTVDAGEANAMTVASADAEGVPSARMVLLKGFDQDGFVFFTNYESGKGHDFAANPRAALLFYWPSLERQVRVGGDVERLERDASIAYFRLRPRGSQIAASISRQSSVVAGRQALEDAVAAQEAALGENDVPVPDYWGGYRVIPSRFEFWQGRPNRLHDRLRYTRQPDGGWLIERLAP
jgi:pyridoxamine 5'-phosphate oxidase